MLHYLQHLTYRPIPARQAIAVKVTFGQLVGTNAFTLRICIGQFHQTQQVVKLDVHKGVHLFQRMLEVFRCDARCTGHLMLDQRQGITAALEQAVETHCGTDDDHAIKQDWVEHKAVGPPSTTIIAVAPPGGCKHRAYIITSTLPPTTSAAISALLGNH